MKLSHFLPIPFPQEYQFCRTSHILWTHYAELYCKDACKMIKKAGVQEACFRPFLLKYTQRKIISKEISLIMATVQTIPMNWSNYCIGQCCQLKYLKAASSRFSICQAMEEINSTYLNLHHWLSISLTFLSGLFPLQDRWGNSTS